MKIRVPKASETLIFIQEGKGITQDVKNTSHINADFFAFIFTISNFPHIFLSYSYLIVIMIMIKTERSKKKKKKLKLQISSKAISEHFFPLSFMITVGGCRGWKIYFSTCGIDLGEKLIIYAKIFEYLVISGLQQLNFLS